MAFSRFPFATSLLVVQLARSSVPNLHNSEWNLPCDRGASSTVPCYFNVRLIWTRNAGGQAVLTIHSAALWATAGEQRVGCSQKRARAKKNMRNGNLRYRFIGPKPFSAKFPH
jgi:hypothetical protein